MTNDLTTRVAKLLWAKLPAPQRASDEIDEAARAVVALVRADLAQCEDALKAANEDVRVLLREIYSRDAYMSPQLKAIHDRLAALRALAVQHDRAGTDMD